jgi:hypothetical protein
MFSSSEKNYIVTEEQILRISELMGCMEDAVKEIIRYSANDTEIYGYRQELFLEKSINSDLGIDEQKGILF